MITPQEDGGFVCETVVFKLLKNSAEDVIIPGDVIILLGDSLTCSGRVRQIRRYYHLCWVSDGRYAIFIGGPLPAFMGQPRLKTAKNG